MAIVKTSRGDLRIRLDDQRAPATVASFIRLGWLEQHDRTYRITQRDRLELRSR